MTALTENVLVKQKTSTGAAVSEDKRQYGIDLLKVISMMKSEKVLYE